MAERKGLLDILFKGFILLSIIATLGIAIAILVTTLNVQSQQKNIVNSGNWNNTGNKNPSNGNPLQDALSVPEPQQIKQGSTQYKSYQDVVTLLKQGLNSSADPCNDFYTYTCGNTQNPLSFYISDDSNYNAMATQMMNTTYVNSAPLPVKQTVAYFNACKYARANWNALVANGSQVTNAINAMKAGDPQNNPSTKNISFPMWDGIIPTAFPDKFGLAYLLSNPEGLYGVATAVTAYVDTNWVDPQGTQGYAMFIDQPSTMVPYTYYVKTWNTERPALIQDVINTMNVYAFSQTGNKNTLNQTNLKTSATDIVDFDYKLAMNFSTNDTTRRQFARSYNPMTIKQLQAAYPFISWHEYIPMVMVQNNDAMQLLAQPNYGYIVMEPAKLKMLSDSLVPNNTWGITPEILQNYVYYAIVSSQSSYLPWEAYSKTVHQRYLQRSAQIAAERSRRRKGISIPRRKIERRQIDDVDKASHDCAGETMEMIQYANARIFIDNIYPTQADRDNIRNNVAKVASSILIGFRSMIDQLNWMSAYTKKGAYNKIDNLVKNIAYPDWITDDNQLSSYYKALNIDTESNDYFSMVSSCNTFNVNSMWNNLLVNGSANRIDFNGPPGTTNAWYQPELNSITFPAAILHQPFYDVNWPASVNFGAMGVIAGHELTHGFDDEGVQWDGVGNLNGWMDPQSKMSFNQMAQCVIDEYSGFCPLDKATYGAGACVDGAQTQGENIADNGGIHAAFRAYKNYINLNGPDPQLPDGILQGFTADQLFFLGFAQVWCQMTPSNAAFQRQILVDVHSPSEYRVWGTIQNFPAFKDAFNCPADSKYAPNSHCNVWVSDISSSRGLPAQDPNSLNIPQAKAAVQSQPQYSNYQSVISLLKQGMNNSADPCNDFYSYTCGAWNSPDMSFDVSDEQNFALIVQQMTNQDYVKAAPSPVQQVVTYFNKCVDARMNWDELLKNDSGKQAVNAINLLMGGDTTEDGHRANVTNSTWPMLYQLKSPYYSTLLDQTTMGFLLGYPAGRYGVNTLISAYVDTNWVDPQGTRGYAYFIDQPNTLLPNTYYVKAWGTYQNKLQKEVVDLMNSYAATQGITLDQTRLQKDAIDLVAFDYALAMNFSTDDTTRRNYARSYNPITIDDLQNKVDFLLWHEFIPLTMLQSHDARMATLFNSSYPFILMEPDMLVKLNQAVKDPNNPFKITTDIIVNYIYYAQLRSQKQYLPTSLKITDPVAHEALKEAEKEMPLPGKRRRRRNVQAVPHKRKWSQQLDESRDEAQMDCAAETMEMLQYANARVFIDKIYPTQADRDNIRNNVAKVASSILIGFRSMIDQLNWMTPYTKKGAYSKIENLVKNIAYPDWITDDNALTMYHQTLNITKDDDYFTVFDKANAFNMYQMFQNLAINGSANRIDFNGPPGTTNAWYQPELNSITFPAAILHQPFYDVNWPASVNFGAMGVIAGHELTHGFDDEGVQWDGVGNLNGWMDSQSQANFSAMAQCVIDEYSGFCPLDKVTYGAGACVDGAQTQGENIADNGGIHAAFRAYKNYINLNGPDPQLPDGILQEFTADQLFFLGFAQVWCQMTPKDTDFQRQILVDVHSPSIYRVWGTIQNFPAFKDAFHCPASAYAPDKHCNVWVSDISSSYGQPPNSQSNQKDINIQSQPQAKQTDQNKYSAYQQSVAFFQNSVNFSADPCNDFWGYACGKYQDKVSFHLADAKNLVLMVNQLTDPAYNATIQANTALTKEKQFFDNCVATTTNNQTQNQTQITLNFMKTKVDALKALLGADFTAVTGTATITKLPNATQMANALGYLSFIQGIDTFVTPMVDTYWPNNAQGYQFFIDQNSAHLAKTYYQPGAWKITEPGYINDTVGVFMQYCLEEGYTCTTTGLTSIVRTLVEFEQTIAYNYSTDDTTRRQYQRSWNLMTSDDMKANYSFIDWTSYLQQVPNTAKNVVTAAGYKISVMETGMTKRLSDDFQNNSTFSPDTIVNYLYMRLLLENAQYLPTYNAYTSYISSLKQEDFVLGKKRRKVPKRRMITGSDVTEVQSKCMSLTNDLMQFANGRVFIDYLYPTNESRIAIRKAAGGVIKNIINSFQGMLMQLDWMTEKDKQAALQKANSENLVQNIAYPDWITTNELNVYYDQLKFNETDNYYIMWDKLIQFSLYLQYNQLNFNKTDRTDFLGQPGTVNAWYQPELNSITFPAGILRPPYFNSNWPASVNYGGLGVVAGHELTHGFDDEGVQWGPTGNLEHWMQNQTGFNQMAQCVITEYDGFCPLDASKYTPNCVNGQQTQGENIADNGGIHSAFRAYRVHTQLNGPDPMLPDQLFGQFTHDQLFFLSFGQVWCEGYRGDDGMYKQLMVDPHSPSEYRVWGTIQNYPAFQSAFNCPANSKYAPSSHCNVWVPNVEA